MTPNRRSSARAGRGAAGATDTQAPGPPDLPWELPHAFLGLEEAASSFESSRVVVLPVPYEATTSWMRGTRDGPRAIVEASRYIELYDQELDASPARGGVHTLPALALTRGAPSEALAELEASYRALAGAAEDRLIVMLGGEHSISAPAIRAQAQVRGARPTVLQLDAHADLRAEHEGTADSHACAMRRVLDVADVVGVGIRGISEEEVEVARANDGVHLIYADDMHSGDGWMDEAIELLSDPVYVTFDVDYLDPALVPSTGTPEPGGGDWYGTLRFLRRVFREREVVACDVVELAPTPGLHAPDFLVAKLVYKMIGYRYEGVASAP